MRNRRKGRAKGMDKGAKTSSARLPQIDGVRGASILTVIAYHYGAAFGQLKPVRDFLELGWPGVNLFFVISGFLIAGILYREKTTKNLFQVFYARRILRIFPLYYLIIAAYAGLIAVGMGRGYGFGDVLRQLLFVQNFTNTFHHDAGHMWVQVTWSLAIEEQFYLAFPLMVLLLPRRWLRGVLIAGLVTAFATRLAGYLIPVRNPIDFAIFFTVSRMDDLFLGALLADALSHASIKAWLARNTRLVTLAAVAIGATILAISWTDARIHDNEFLMRVFGSSLLAWISACVVILVTLREDGAFVRAMKAPVLRWLGARTYAIYLFHMPAVYIVQGVLAHFGRTMTAPAYLAAFALTLIGAAISWVLLEGPLLKVGHSVKYRREPAAAGQPVGSGNALSPVAEAAA